MVLSAAVIFAFASLPNKTSLDFSVDCFLVGGNEHTISGFDWMKDPSHDDSIQSKLRPLLAACEKARMTFCVIDCGERSAPSKRNEFTYAHVSKKGFDTVDSVAETRTVRGVLKTKVLGRTNTEDSVSASVAIKPIGETGYVSQGFVYFGRTSPNQPHLILQDLNSFQQASKNPADPVNKGPNLLLSRNSVVESKEFLKKNKLPVNGICLCQWGIPQEETSNFIAFPPEGVIGHYKLARYNDLWSMRLVEYVH